MKMFNIISFISKGVPFRMPKDVDWSEIKTPIFPFLFSIISGFAFGAIPFRIVKGMLVQRECPTSQIIQSFLLTMFSSSAIFIVLNGLILLFIWGCLRQFKRAARVLYISVFFQMLLLIFFFIVDYLYFPSVLDIFISCLILCFVLLRFLATFFSLKREVSNNILPFLYSFTCVDAWYVLNLVWHYYFW
ncbi:MAG: hypothetical protein K8R02_06975 [Anaerohalosphaeraceae bacterium]|nr:hypothetical protein [Anaerohalosphaeraceae bacterium]